MLKSILLLDSNYKKIAKFLSLDKPLVIFDLEATGISISSDKIIELAYVKIWENGTVKEEDFFFNPEMDIAPEATAVHGITNEIVKDKETFSEKAQYLWEVFNNSYYAGFNILNFDLPILRREFIRTGMDFDYNVNSVIDTREIFRFMARRSLAFAYEYYCGKQLKLGHTAPLNTQVALEILSKQLDKYKEIRDWEFIKKINRRTEDEFIDADRKFYWRKGEAHFGFSKYKNRALKEIVKEDKDFLEWVLTADFSDEVKDIIKQALEGKSIKKRK